MKRSEQRRAAVFALYQHDLTARPLSETLGRNATAMTRSLAHAAADRQDELDELIARHAVGWRAIMRVALLEMLHPDAVEARTPIPPEGAIDEAVQSAKEFCGAQAPAFVNGILDAVLREVRAGAPQ